MKSGRFDNSDSSRRLKVFVYESMRGRKKREEEKKESRPCTSEGRRRAWTIKISYSHNIVWRCENNNNVKWMWSCQNQILAEKRGS